MQEKPPSTLISHKVGHLESKVLLCIARSLRNVLIAWMLSQRKPYTAITVQIDRLTSEQYELEDLSGIVDLIEVIRIQDSGPTETARAIRKKLYVLLDLLVNLVLTPQ